MASKSAGKSYQISDTLYLNEGSLGKESKKKVAATPPSTNHIGVIDCSGSMSSELPRIREQVKARLPKLMRKGDTFSLIWFSGRGQCGVLLKAEPIADLTDLLEVNKAIDRWLQPIGMTGFVEPIREVAKLVTDVRKKNSNPFSLWFMSDGCDNQWSQMEILNALAGVEVSSATFVEYGYYADRPLLTKMAERLGGQLIFAENFDKYQPQFESAIQKKVSGCAWAKIYVGHGAVSDFSFALKDGDLMTYAVEGGASLVPEDLGKIFTISTGPEFEVEEDLRAGDVRMTTTRCWSTLQTSSTQRSEGLASTRTSASRRKRLRSSRRWLLRNQQRSWLRTANSSMNSL